MHDVIISGGGLAGGYINKLLGDSDVLVLEKNRKIAPRDSGIVSARFFEMAKDIFDAKRFVRHEIRRMRINSAVRSFVLDSDEPFAYILKRESLLEFFRKERNVRYETITNIIYSENGVMVETNKAVHEAKMLIGCDGAASVARRSAGIESPALYTGMLARTKKTGCDEINVFFNKFYSPDFFSWVIPQNSEYGLVTGISPRERLEYFRKSQNLKKGRTYSHPIPIGITKSFSNRLLLVGDACGQTKPITCGGIIFSMTAARRAAAVANSAIESSRFDERFLSEYEKKWMHEFGNEIKKQMLFRRIYRNMSNRDIDSFFSTFGQHAERIDGFDYDKLSLLWKRVPKTRLTGFVLRNARHLF